MDLYIFKFLFLWFMLICFGESKLSKPRRLKTSVLSSDSIKVQWYYPHVSTRLIYKVRYAKVAKRKTYSTFTTKKSNVIIEKLQANTTYEFAVRVQDGKGRGRVSSWSSAALNRTFKIVSGTVSALRAIPLSSSSIRLNWKLPPQRNRTSGFFILWSEVEKNDLENKVAVSKQANSTIFMDLVPNRQYSFRVVTLKANGVEKSTGKIYARPYQDRPGQAPRNVTLELLSNSVLQIRWVPPPVKKRHGILQSYKLQYRRKGARRGDVCTVTLSERPRKYNLTELQRGETYRIRIAARTVNGTGPYSKWASIDIPQKWKGKRRKSVKKYQPSRNSNTLSTTAFTRSPNDGYPEMPEGLKATALSSTRIQLSWNVPASPICCPIVAYTIHVTNLDNLNDERELVTGPNTEAVILDLDPSTYYGFNVTAINTQGVSHNSEEIIQKTKEPVVPVIADIHYSNAIEGGIVNLTCIAAGDPLPWVSWHSTNSTAFAPSHSEVKSFLNRQPEKGTNEMIVMFQDVSTRQAGEYMCVAKNIAGKINATLDLQIKVPVRFKEVEGGTAMIESSVNLTCAASGIPLPTLTWLSPEGQEAYHDKRAKIYEWIETELEYEHVGIVKVLYKVLQLDNILMSDGGNYTCLAQNDVGFSRRKVALKIKVPPPPPVKNLVAFPVSPSVVLVSWEKPNYNFTITSYKVIYRKKDNGVEQSIDTMEQLCHINDLSPDKMYKIKVLAFNKRYGEPSRVDIRTLPNKKLQPANVSAVALNSSIIRLNWEAPNGIDRAYIKGYNIYYRKENGTEQEKLFTEGSRNKQFLIGLGKEEIYFLRISTLMTWGDEAPSQWIKIKKTAQELLPPSEPTNVLVTPASEKVRITWQSPAKARGSQDLKGYRIVYGPKDDTTAKIKKIRVSKLATRHTISSLIPATAYIISLRSFNDYGESAPIYIRTTTKATRPGPVQSASATPLSSTTILVSWLTPTRGQATDYHVRYWRPYKNDKQSQWLKAPQTNLTAKGLRKFREYKFEIIPYHAGEIGESTVLFARTKSDVPDAPPKKILIKAINSTAMLISWESPHKAHHNGRITGYKLVFKRVQSSRPLATFTVEGNRKNYTFYGLEPSMKYKARVAAMTIRGTGPYSKWHTDKTKQVDKLPPEKPSALILSSTDKSIHINWTQPRYTGAPLNGYIMGYGRYIPEVNRQILTSDVLSYVIRQLRENTEYIISVRAFNIYGESVAIYDFIKTKDVPLKLEAPEIIKALTLSTTSIGIHWIDPALNKFKRRDRRQYTLRYSSESETEYRYLNVSRPPVILDDLQVYTQYEFAIRIVRGSEFSTWSLPESNTTFMEPPVSYPANLTATTADIPSKVTISWNAIKDPDRKTEKYIVYYTTNQNQGLKLWNKLEFKSGKKSVTIDELESTTTYFFKIQAVNAGGHGPLSTVLVYRSFTADARTAPTNIRIRPLSNNMSTAVDVSWSAPIKKMGAIIGYLVSYTSTPKIDGRWVTQSERGQSAILLGLQYKTVYYVKVQARYAANILGPMSVTGLYRTPEQENIIHKRDNNEHEKEDPINFTVTTTNIPIKVNISKEPDLNVAHHIQIEQHEKNSNKVYISWSPPIKPHKPIIGYIITYSDDSSMASDRSTLAVVFGEDTSDVIGDLQENTTYYFQIQAKYISYLGPLSDPVNFTTSLSEEPINLTVTTTNIPIKVNISKEPDLNVAHYIHIKQHGQNCNKVDISWSPPIKIDKPIIGYIITYSDDSSMASDRSAVVVFGGDTSNVIGDLQENTTYYFQIQAEYTSYLGPLSDPVNFTTSLSENTIHQMDNQNKQTKEKLSILDLISMTTTNIPIKVNILEEPDLNVANHIEIKQHGRNHNVVDISWSPPIKTDEPIIGYIINYSDDSSMASDRSVLAVVFGEDTSDVIGDLQENTTYYFQIQAKYISYLGPLSDPVNFTTSLSENTIQKMVNQNKPTKEKPTILDPITMTTTNIPTNINILEEPDLNVANHIQIKQHGRNHNVVDISWSPPIKTDEPIIGYIINYSDDSSMASDRSAIGVVFGGDTSDVIGDLKENTTYYFQIQAKYISYFGPLSDPVNFTTSLSGTTTQIPPTITETMTLISTIPSFLPPPLSLVLTSTNSTITVTWTQPTQNGLIQKYIITYWSDNSSKHVIMVDKDAATELSMILFDLDPSTMYTIKLVSSGHGMNSENIYDGISTKITE